MSTHLEAVYENGVFRPLNRVHLPDNQRVKLTVDPLDALGDGGDQAHFTLSATQWQSFCAALDEPPRVIPALRQLLTEPSLFDDDTRASS